MSKNDQRKCFNVCDLDLKSKYVYHIYNAIKN